MLQQTQASVVIPYFERWMESFPTISALAQAPQDEVIKLWEGLGYYARARHLHAAARQIERDYGGELPRDLSGIKGIGPYTRGAIRSLAFHERSAAVDGNVRRVLSRFFAAADISHLAEEILPFEEPWLIAEGLIELGALVCKRKPECRHCPLRSECKAYAQAETHLYPPKKVRPKTTHLKRHVGVIVHQDHILLTRGEKGKVMSDLYEFPFVDVTEDIEKHLNLRLTPLKSLPEQRHTFTRYRVQLLPYLYRAEERPARFLWRERASLMALPFSSGHRRILNQLMSDGEI